MATEGESMDEQQFRPVRDDFNSTFDVVDHHESDANIDQLEMSNDAARSSNISNRLFTFSRTTFWQRMLIFSFIRLAIYLNKLYQDFEATSEYKGRDGLECFHGIAVLTLIVPPILYTLFLVGASLSKEEFFDEKEILTRLFNGLLLVPWQIKRYLDVLHFYCQRVCNFKSPNEDEKQNLRQLQMLAEVLEFFEDFYAGFLQILLQVYIFLGTDDWIDSHRLSVTPLFGALVGSILSVLSMMIAVRRRDDRLVTGILSFFGWLSFISSRVLVFALVATVIHSWIIVLCLIHVLIFSIWIYNIAISSYGISTADMASVQLSSRRKRLSIAILVFFFFGVPSLLIWPIMFQLKEGKRPLIFLLICTIENLVLLGIWLVWSMSNEGPHLSDSLVLFIISIVTATLAGDFLLMMYVFCKPTSDVYTDQVVLYEIQQSRNMEAPTLVRLDGINCLASNAFQYGIFYVFCDIVFKLPTTHKTAPERSKVRQSQFIND